MEETIRTIDPSWPKDLIIRALYVRLAPFFQRDISYFLADTTTQVEMYKKDFAGTKPQGVCKTLCEFYQKLLMRFDIDSKLIKVNNNAVPHFALLACGEGGKWIFIDPLKDLVKNQTHMKTRYFGQNPEEDVYSITDLHPNSKVLDDEYLKEMDEFLGHIENGIYYDAFLSILHNELSVVKAKERILAIGYPSDIDNSEDLIDAKIWTMSKFLINTCSVPGPYERVQFYRRLRAAIFNKSEIGKIKVVVEKTGDIYLNRDFNGITIRYKEEQCDTIKKLVLKEHKYFK